MWLHAISIKARDSYSIQSWSVSFSSFLFLIERPSLKSYACRSFAEQRASDMNVASSVSDNGASNNSSSSAEERRQWREGRLATQVILYIPPSSSQNLKSRFLSPILSQDKSKKKKDKIGQFSGWDASSRWQTYARTQQCIEEPWYKVTLLE